MGKPSGRAFFASISCLGPVYRFPTATGIDESTTVAVSEQTLDPHALMLLLLRLPLFIMVRLNDLMEALPRADAQPPQQPPAVDAEPANLIVVGAGIDALIGEYMRQNVSLIGPFLFAKHGTWKGQDAVFHVKKSSCL